MSKRGWSNAGLPAVGDDGTLWTVTDGARLLGPPELSVAQVRTLIRLAGVAPVGIRRTPGSGRGARVYRADDLIRVYEALHGVADQPSDSP